MGVYLIVAPVGFLTGWLIGVLYRPLPRSLLLLHHAVSSNATTHVVTTTTAKITITNLIVTAIPGLIAVTTLIMVLIGVLLLEASSSEVRRGQFQTPPNPRQPGPTPRPYLVGIVVLIVIVAVLGLLYGMANAKLASVMGMYEALKANYTSLRSLYDSLLVNYTTLKNQPTSINASLASVMSQYGMLKANYTNLQSQYVKLQANYTTLMSLYGVLQVNYTNLLNQYNSLQGQYKQLEAKYTNLETAYEEVTSNYKGYYEELMREQLLSELRLLDNITLSQMKAGIYEALIAYIFIPYGFNALVTLNTSCTNTTEVGIDSYRFGWVIVPFNITGPTTLTLIQPFGFYTPFLWSMSDNNNMRLTVTTVILSNISNYLDIVEREDTYKFTKVATEPYLPWANIPIIVPYGYNITLSVNITSNEPMTIRLIQKAYNGAVQDINLAYNTQSYQGVLTLTSNYYYQISISPSQGATVNVDIKPIAIKPIG